MEQPPPRPLRLYTCSEERKYTDGDRCCYIIYAMELSDLVNCSCKIKPDASSQSPRCPTCKAKAKAAKTQKGPKKGGGRRFQCIKREISPLGEFMQGKTCPFLVDINGDLYALAGSPASLIASSAFEVFDSRNKCWNPLPDHPLVGSRWLRPFFSYAVVGTKIMVYVPESPLFCFAVAEPAVPWRRLPPRLPTHGTGLVLLDGQLMFTYAFALSKQAFTSCLEHNYYYYDDYYADHHGVYNASGSNWGVVACQLSSTDSNDFGTWIKPIQFLEPRLPSEFWGRCTLIALLI
ncbi:hypothetical protein C1H46_042678 [Malus baccata]|uniref:Uncharacterized protein n=1 Tax=Malus baccata TaxID=106549 RepID=A0A540KC22_MALBA|nr:hypothetical protein C1H46_042678 [Malus baccata]